MSSLTDLLRKLFPSAIKRIARRHHRHLALSRGVRRLRALMHKKGGWPPDVFPELIYGWGNEGWSADAEYLERILDRVVESRGSVLECGSGVSTLIAGIAAQAAGVRLISLENHPAWAERVRAALRQHHVHAAEVLDAPLRDYGEFEWYTLPEKAREHRYQVVICDGPPGTTRGGRYGLLPVAQSLLTADCSILVDDAARAAERSILERWHRQAGWTFELHGSAKQFAEARRVGPA